MTLPGALFLLIVAGTGNTPTDGLPLPHDAEIKLFGSTMAVARTVGENCPGTTVDARYLEARRQHLHVIEADRPAFAVEAHATGAVFEQAISSAPSRQAWCDAVYRLYGPGGKMIRGLMRR